MGEEAPAEKSAGVRMLTSQKLVVRADHGQIYIRGIGADDESWDTGGFDPSDGPELRALDDAVDSRRFVGSAGRGFIDLLTPGQYNFKTPMTLELWNGEPPDDRDHWDHEVDIDLDAPVGRIEFSGSGGDPSPAVAEVSAGSFRARVSGAGYDAIANGEGEGDSYRVRLWPRKSESPPELRKSWPYWRHRYP